MDQETFTEHRFSTELASEYRDDNGILDFERLIYEQIEESGWDELYN